LSSRYQGLTLNFLLEKKKHLTQTFQKCLLSSRQLHTFLVSTFGHTDIARIKVLFFPEEKFHSKKFASAGLTFMDWLRH
jgi:hypothetical protein